MKGGRDPLFFSGQPHFHSLYPSSLLLAPQGIQCHFHFVYSPLQPLDTSGRASACGKAADAGQRGALEREAEQATVDAATPDHLEPPPCASRGASTSATRHRAGPPPFPLCLAHAARAQSRPSLPMRVRARGSTRSSPRSLSLFLAPYSTPTSTADNPSLSPLAARAVTTATSAPRPR